MSDPEGKEFFVWTLFQQLVRRQFALGLEEYGAVMHALRAGFGWSSRDDLKQVLCAVWATSREESAVVSALFDQYVIPDWNVTTALPQPIDTIAGGAFETPTGEQQTATDSRVPPPSSEPLSEVPPAPTLASANRLPPLRLEELPRLPYSHVFLPQYPVTYRHVAQMWRRLRRPLREGPAIELDVDATVARRSRLGVASPPVLAPRRRNQAHLLLLVDRKGSMAPFHDYVVEVCNAIAQAGRLGRVGMFYFHDTPLEGADLSVLDALPATYGADLDPIVNAVPALTSGELYVDPQLLEPYGVESVFDEWTGDTAIVVISDAGAARGRFDAVRLLDTIATLKGLLGLSRHLVWLNPMPSSSWMRSTASSIARHVPMFPMDRDGMHRAVNVLRGQPTAVVRPLPRVTRLEQSPATAVS